MSLFEEWPLSLVQPAPVEADGIPQWVAYAVIAGAAVLAVMLLALLLRKRARPPAPQQVFDHSLNLASLDTLLPSATSVEVKFRNVPVRLVALVVAPVGRGQPTPSNEKLAQLLDEINPGFAEAIGAHETRIKVWPPQVSARGFAQSFFHQVRIPGERGKDSPWCSVAGRFDAAGMTLMLGIAMRTEKPQSMGCFPVEHSHTWYDMFRVSDGA
jgi:hypothetical protein